MFGPTDDTCLAGGSLNGMHGSSKIKVSTESHPILPPNEHLSPSML